MTKNELTRNANASTQSRSVRVGGALHHVPGNISNRDVIGDFSRLRRRFETHFGFDPLWNHRSRTTVRVFFAL